MKLGFVKLSSKVVKTMMNYNHRQLLTGVFVTLLCLFAVCSPLPADEVAGVQLHRRHRDERASPAVR